MKSKLKELGWLWFTPIVAAVICGCFGNILFNDQDLSWIAKAGVGFMMGALLEGLILLGITTFGILKGWTNGINQIR